MEFATEFFSALFWIAFLSGVAFMSWRLTEHWHRMEKHWDHVEKGQVVDDLSPETLSE